MTLELKIYAFVIFINTLLFTISFLKWKFKNSPMYFKYYIKDEYFGAFGLCLSYILLIAFSLRILMLIAIWWFGVN